MFLSRSFDFHVRSVGSPTPSFSSHVFVRSSRTVGSRLGLQLHQRIFAAWDGCGRVPFVVLGLGVRRLGEGGGVGCVPLCDLDRSMCDLLLASSRHVGCGCDHAGCELRHDVVLVPRVARSRVWRSAWKDNQ
eukprot:scaffold923_cov288-Pavlova_lutheri.AAC.3